jgi:uncharacterized membrane protein HdeD (DUF308 family)
MVGPIGLGLLALVVGIVLLFVPGIAIIGIILIILGIVLMAGAFGASRRRTGPGATRTQ